MLHFSAMAAQDGHDIQQLPYEQALEQLEALLDQMESGRAGLEQSLELYERGKRLANRCREILGRAEARMAELTLEPSGRLQLTEDVPVSSGSRSQEPEAHDESSESDSNGH